MARERARAEQRVSRRRRMNLAIARRRVQHQRVDPILSCRTRTHHMVRVIYLFKRRRRLKYNIIITNSMVT